MDLNKIKIDFEFSFDKFKNSSGSKIRFEIKNLFNFNSNAGKLNLIFRLYITIFI
jgi:hypothetical protein